MKRTWERTAEGEMNGQSGIYAPMSSGVEVSHTSCCGGEFVGLREDIAIADDRRTLLLVLDR
jgi:hypothetical protein